MKPIHTLLSRLTVATLAFDAFTSFTHGADSFGIKVTEGQHVDVVRGGAVVAKFMTAHDVSTPERRTETYKPYLHVFDPSGTVQLTKGPGGVFPHHRGIFVGFSKIAFGGKSYDRWHMAGGDQVVRSVTSANAPERAQVSAEIEWEGAAKEALLTEKREMNFTVPQKPFYLGVELRTSLKPAGGEAMIAGDPEHAGVQFRASEKIEGAKTAYIFPGENVDAHKQRDLPWVAMIFTVEGKTFTALMLNPPGNPADTAFSAYRDYGRFGAYPKGTATPDAPLTLKYQWLFAEGEVRDAAVLQGAWNAFAGKSEPTPALTIRGAAAKSPATPKANTPPKK